MATDPRIPVMFADPARVAALLRADDALLAEDGLAIPDGGLVSRFGLGAASHAFGCTCCAGRSPPAQALAALFLARARGEAVFFRRVIAVVRDVTLVRGLLEDDVMVRGRFLVSAEATPTVN
jgi:hypothetical protein